MKRVYGGMRYNTASGIEVGTYAHKSDDPMSEWAATLYKTPLSGKFFLAGVGGAMTRFCAGWHHGQFLYPMDRADALRWAEAYLGREAIIKHFI